jgi:hypothetical protein
MNQITLPDGVTAENAGGRYDAKTFTMKIKLVLAGCAKKSMVETEYESWRQFHGLPEWGFRLRNFEGDEFEMFDYKPRSPRFPVIAKNLRTGKSYKFPVTTIQMFLKRG